MTEFILRDNHDRCPYCNGYYACTSCGEPLLSEQDILSYINRLWRRGSRVYGSMLARRYGVPARTMYDYLERLIAKNQLARRDGQYGYYPPV